MTTPEDELLLVSCIDYMLEYGGLAFIELIISVKEEKRQLKYSVDPSVYSEPLSLDVELSSDESSLMEVIADESKGPMEIAEDRSTVAFIDSLVSKLRPKQQEVICMRFGLRGYDAHTLESIGIKLGITRERVRQIEAEVFKILLKMLNKKGFDKNII